MLMLAVHRACHWKVIDPVIVFAHVERKGIGMPRFSTSFLSISCIFLFLSFPVVENADAAEVQYSSCQGGDLELSGQDGIVYCEPLESQEFWVGKGDLINGSLTKAPAGADRFDRVSLESNNCVSGNCIRIEIPQYECCGLGVVWPLDEAGLAPDNLYFRYYLKLGENFDPSLCSSDGSSGDGGKFPGLADTRAYPEEQCGNGGNPSDGLNCWSARSLFKSCTWACESTPSASIRYGTYAYYPNQDGATGDNLVWDGDVNRQSGPTCSISNSQAENCPAQNIIPCSSSPDVVGTCGIEDVGDLENGRWYAIEMQVRMNTVSQEDGIMRGWVDGDLAYEKTNMVWRLPGHDNLHVRLVWLNVFFGGSLVGPCMSGGTEIFMDQMVVSTQPIGVIGAFEPNVAPGPPEDLVTD